jgi:hypothetical protein
MGNVKGLSVGIGSPMNSDETEYRRRRPGAGRGIGYGAVVEASSRSAMRTRSGSDAACILRMTCWR